MIAKEKESLQDYIAAINPDALFADGLDDALIGHGGQFNQVVAVYSTEKALDIFEKDGMSRDEAREHFDFNVVGAWVGENTPIFVDLF